jgi:hypothetical protein
VREPSVCRVDLFLIAPASAAWTGCKAELTGEAFENVSVSSPIVLIEIL